MAAIDFAVPLDSKHIAGFLFNHHHSAVSTVKIDVLAAFFGGFFLLGIVVFITRVYADTMVADVNFTPLPQ